MIIGLVVLLVLCPCLGLAGWAVWQAADDDPDEAPSPSVSAPLEPTDVPSADPSTAEPSPSEDDDYAKGDCVVNDGTDDDAELRKVPCGPNTYEVLLRLPATTDADQCKTRAPRSTAHYVHDNSVDLLDYVLCLRKR
ncbi:LppU/SCO3897 family protein [Micromonospora sp. LZ34]